MLRVFIVDDESVIRIGFRHLDWKRYNCELVGDASNGLDALAQVAQLKPDVIISDICMPQMDGLEFSRLVKHMEPQCSIILLTGYDEFSYAQMALNIGVDFLMLKPTNFDELASMLHQIEERRQQKKHLSGTLETGTLSALIQGNILREMLLGRNQFPEAEHIFIRNEHIFRRFCILCFLPCPPVIPSELNNIRSVLSKTCLSVAQENAMDMIYTDTEDAFVCLLRIPEELTGTCENYVNLFCQDVLSRLQKYNQIDMFCGCSQMHTEVMVRTAYLEALQALNGCFLLHSTIFTYAEEVPCAFSVQRLAKWKDQLSASVFSGCAADVQECFDTLLDLMDAYVLSRNQEACDKVRMMLHTFVWETAQKLKVSRSLQKLPLDQAIQDFLHSGISATLPGVYSIVKNLALQITKALHETLHMQSAAVFVAYIQEHFQDVDLSLESLAEVFELSPSHMSRIIKRETGVSFIEHLTTFRIEHAKELLADSSLTLSAISSEIGFRDMSYFIHVFKRYVGITPNSYRKLYSSS